MAMNCAFYQTEVQGRTERQCNCNCSVGAFQNISDTAQRIFSTVFLKLAVIALHFLEHLMHIALLSTMPSSVQCSVEYRVQFELFAALVCCIWF